MRAEYGRAVPPVYRRRRLAAVGLAGLVLVLAAQAGKAFGSAPLGTSGAHPSAPARVEYVVEPGDTLWSIASGISPDADPRKTVRVLEKARGDEPLIPGETILYQP